MHLTAPEEYGLRCMLQLAREGEGGSLTIPEIADREGMSAANAGKIMALLKRAGLVRSVRGRQGGYRLARPAGKVSVAEVLTALGGDLYGDGFCGRYRGENASCVHSSDCAIRSMWSLLEKVVHGVLERTTLTDLLCRESTMASWLKERVGAQPVRLVASIMKEEV